MRKRKFAYFFIFLTVIFSCSRKELIEEIKIENNSSKLVVFSLITPEKWIYVNVRKTLLVGEINNRNTADSTFDLISNANVEIINLQTKVKKKIPEINRGVYGIAPKDFQIVEGGSYGLIVNFQNLSTYAECVVPPNSTVIDTVITKLNDLVIKNESDTTTIVLSRSLLKAKDISTPNNRYEYLGYSTETNVIDKLNKITTFASTNFFIIEKELNQCNFQINTGLNKNDVKVTQTWQILTIYPLFHEFLKVQQFQKNELSVSQNSPFLIFRGVTPTITNIQNGYGIFAGYLISPPKQIVVTR